MVLVNLAVLGLLYSFISHCPLGRELELASAVVAFALLVLGASMGFALSRSKLSTRARRMLYLIHAAVYCAMILVLMTEAYPTRSRLIFGFAYSGVVIFHATRFAFSWPMLAAATLPSLALAVAYGDLEATICSVAGAGLYILVSAAVGSERTHQRRKARLLSAVEAADRVAVSCLEVALASTARDLRTFAHQLRNGLTPVVNNLVFLAKDEAIQGESREALDEARRGLDKSCALLAQLSKSIARGASRSLSKFRLDAVLKQAASERSVARLASGLPIFEIPGQPEHLRAALDHLIRNAEEAGAQQVLLKACIGTGGQRAVLSISDNGPGIPGEVREQLFAPPRQSNGGAGVGLYVARRMVDLLGGEICLTSNSPRGATFQMVLPGAVPHERQPS
jgi:signal transduction histidine kinase